MGVGNKTAWQESVDVMMNNDNENQYKQKMSLGHSAAWEQKWRDAIRYYKAALELIPDDYDGLTHLGLAYYESGEMKNSVTCYQKAAKQREGDPISFDKLGQLHEQLGENDLTVKYSLIAGELYLKAREVHRAIENWVRVTRVSPENMQAHSRLAVVYEHLGYKPQAIREYLILASLYQHKRDQQNAIKTVQRALELSPSSKETKEALALINSGNRLPLPTIVKIAVATPAKMRVTEDRGQFDDGSIAEQNDPIKEAHQNALKTIANYLFEEEDRDNNSRDRVIPKGLQVIVEGAKNLITHPVDATKVNLHLVRMFELQTMEDNQRAADELEKAISVGLNHAAAYFELGYMRFQTNRLESSIRSLQRAVNHQDYTLGTRLMLGKIFTKMGRIDQALIEYLQALRIADNHTVDNNQIAELNQLYDPVIETICQQTKTNEKGEICDRIQELLVRPDWKNHIQKAREQINAQVDHEQLIPMIEFVTKAGGSYLVDSLGRINILARDGHLRSAMEEAFLLLEHVPGYLPLHICIGELLARQEQHEEAIAKFLTVARTYEIRNEPDRAIEVYKKVIGLEPMATTPRHQLITQLISLGRVRSAIEEIIALAEAYYHLADLEKARNVYLQGLQVASEDSALFNLQIVILHRIADIDMQSLNWRRSIQLYEQIKRLQPDDETCRYRLIDLHRRLGQERKAVDEIDIFIRYYIQNHLNEKALQFVDKLIGEYPDWEPLTARLEQLQRM